MGAGKEFQTRSKSAVTCYFYAEKCLIWLDDLQNKKHPSNGKKWQSDPLYGKKWQCLCGLFSKRSSKHFKRFPFPDTNHFLWFSLPFVTIYYHNGFQFSKQPASNIQFAHQFVKSYLKNTPSWVILIRDGVMMEYFL